MKELDRVVTVKCAVGEYHTTQREINAQQKAIKKTQINTETEKAIFKALGVKDKESALIKQITQLSGAVAFLATKTDKRTLKDSEKAEIEKQLNAFGGIQQIVAQGKEAKDKL